jgi:hypothetical protein
MTAPQETLAAAWSVRLAFELSANDQIARALAAGLTEGQLNWQLAPARGVLDSVWNICVGQTKPI